MDTSKLKGKHALKKTENAYYLYRTCTTMDEIYHFWFLSDNEIYDKRRQKMIEEQWEFEFEFELSFYKEEMKVTNIESKAKKDGVEFSYGSYTHKTNLWLATKQLEDELLQLRFMDHLPYDFPDEWHARTRSKRIHPAAVYLKCLHDETDSFALPLVEYRHPSEEEPNVLYLTREMTYYVHDLPDVYDTFEEAWESFEQLLKKTRLNLLFE